jgi:hypothetical protein
VISVIFRDLLNDAKRQWKAALVLACVVFGALGLGLFLRPGFVGSVTYEVGGIVYIPLETKRNIRFLEFEAPSQLENFFANDNLPNMRQHIGDACEAKAAYSPDGYRLNLTCKSRTREQLRQIIADVSQPFLDRHDRLFRRATLIEEQRVRSLERRVAGTEEQINVLKLDATSGLAKARKIELEVILAELRDELSLEGIMGVRVKATRMAPSGVVIVDRQPGLALWLSVMLLSLGLGAFFAIIMTRATLSEHH